MKLQSKRAYFCPMSAVFCAIDVRESIKWMIVAAQSIQLCFAYGPQRACSDPSVYWFEPGLFTDLAHMQ